MAPAVLGISFWFPGSAPAGATLALIRTVHAALGNSVLELEQIRASHVLEVGRERKVLSGNGCCWDILSPLGNA